MRVKKTASDATRAKTRLEAAIAGGHRAAGAATTVREREERLGVWLAGTKASNQARTATAHLSGRCRELQGTRRRLSAGGGQGPGRPVHPSAPSSRIGTPNSVIRPPHRLSAKIEDRTPSRGLVSLARLSGTRPERTVRCGASTVTEWMDAAGRKRCRGRRAARRSGRVERAVANSVISLERVGVLLRRT